MSKASGFGDSDGGLRLCFGVDFDSGAWPGPLDDRRDRCFGEAWVGPLRLLELLETALGVSGAFASDVERAVALIPELPRHESYFSRSLAADPLGTAIGLVRDRDALWLRGWRGQAASPRLHELARAVAGVSPGLPDRLVDVVKALAARSPGIAAIRLADPIAGLPSGWRHIFERLIARGTEILPVEIPAVPARGDLAAARAEAQPAPFGPAGDGSLQLVRARGWLAAADDLAAYLAAQPSLTGAVVIGADSVLDRALGRHGLPTLGGGAGGGALLAVLPLAAELAWAPADPAAVHQLLALPDGPIPGPVADRLIEALRDWPAVGSEAWDDALELGLEQVAPQQQSGARARVRALLACGIAHGERCPRDEIMARTQIVETWARARAYVSGGRTGGGTGSPAHEAVAVQCRALRELLKLSGAERITPPELRRYLALATDATVLPPQFPAEAGLGAVAHPGGVAGPARTVVWWGFARERAQRPAPMALSQQDLGALADLGVDLPDPGAEAIAIAARWRRPLEQARETLLLVCPERGPAGDALHPHPFLDEILAGVPPDNRNRAIRRIGCARPRGRYRPARAQVAAAPLPAPVRRFTAPAPVPGREVESPAGLETLLGCPLAWALTYHGGLCGGASAAPPAPSPRLAGALAREIIGRVIAETPGDPDAAFARAQRVFDDRGPSLAAPLFLPRHRAERARLRHEVAESARALVAMLVDSGATAEVVETERSRPALGGTLAGAPDVVVARAGAASAAVIDLAWGDRRRARDALENGTALELAAHAHLCAHDGAMPAVGYFLVDRHTLLAAERAALAGATEVDAVAPEVTWAAARETAAIRRAELDGGVLFAPGNPDGADEPHRGESQLFGGALDVAPPCDACRFGALCGRSFARSDRSAGAAGSEQ